MYAAPEWYNALAHVCLTAGPQRPIPGARGPPLGPLRFPAPGQGATRGRRPRANVPIPGAPARARRRVRQGPAERSVQGPQGPAQQARRPRDGPARGRIRARGHARPRRARGRARRRAEPRVAVGGPPARARRAPARARRGRRARGGARAGPEVDGRGGRRTQRDAVVEPDAAQDRELGGVRCAWVCSEHAVLTSLGRTGCTASGRAWTFP
jgi:hypothetical protein